MAEDLAGEHDLWCPELGGHIISAQVRKVDIYYIYKINNLNNLDVGPAEAEICKLGLFSHQQYGLEGCLVFLCHSVSSLPFFIRTQSSEKIYIYTPVNRVD